MALQNSGAISLNDIHVEAGGSSGSSATINDTDIRALISKGSGASMSFNEWYGASNYPSGGAMWGSRWVASSGANRSNSFYWNYRMDYHNFTTSSASSDFGDSTGGTHGRSVCSNGSRVVFSGNYYTFSSNGNRQDYITTSSLSNSINFGNLTASRHSASGVEDQGGRGLICGGSTGKYPYAPTTIIEYIQIASTSGSTDFGDLVAINMQMGNASGTGNRCLIAGGPESASNQANSNRIQYITTSSTSNATDAGNLTVARVNPAGLTNGSRACFAGGKFSLASYGNTIDYVAIASTSNATDFGNLTVSHNGAFGASDGTYGMIGGGYTGNSTSTRKDRISVATTSNASYFSTLGLPRHSCDAGSGTT